MAGFQLALATLKVQLISINTDILMLIFHKASSVAFPMIKLSQLTRSLFWGIENKGFIAI